MTQINLYENCSVGTPDISANSFHYDIIPIYQVLKNEGNMAWEYHPLRNFRSGNALYKTNSLNQLVDIDGNLLEPYKGVTLTKRSVRNMLYYNIMPRVPDNAVRTAEAMELTEFTTEKLNFDLNHPVQIECQPSYDGSVNLILNDDKNPPRLINTRFTPIENNRYRIINRFGNNDANIYDEEEFEIDTSLYKRISRIPQVRFIGVEDGGACKVGNYVFYFRLEDADGNMTDFVGESGVVTCHIGGVNDIFAIKAGLRDENSNKMIKFELNDVDPSYSYVRVYYTRTTSDLDEIRVTKNYLIDHKYVVKSTDCSITITGYETVNEVSDSEINVQYNLVESAKSAAQCQNMLFLANVEKVDIPYEELTDLSLRVFPIPVSDINVGCVDYNYQDTSNKFEYYNVNNIYNRLGYWDEEIYRLGIVYIMKDFTLSPVFNIRGRDELDVEDTVGSASIENNYTVIDTFTGEIDADGSPVRQKIVINDGDYRIMTPDGTPSDIPLENAKGVIRIKNTKASCVQIQGSEQDMISKPIGIRIAFDTDALSVLRTLVKGFFIVRQKRIPTILAQAFTIGLDKNAYVPLLKVDYNEIDSSFEGDYKWIAERFIDDNRKVVQDYKKRLYEYPEGYMGTKMKAAICPEAELQTSYFNQLFTGGKYTITMAKYQPTSTGGQDDDYKLAASGNDVRHYYVNSYHNDPSYLDNEYAYTQCKITLVEDDTPMITSGTQKYCARCGSAEEAWRLRYLQSDNVSTDATNLIRGSWGTYIGIEGFDQGFGRIINIHIPGYDITKMKDYFQIRYDDKSSFYPITDRIDINQILPDSTGYSTIAYRGDCYICNFTHRMNRNFQDPEAPNNDVIVNEDTWSDNYEVDQKEKNENINRGDINAVQLGHWVTFKLCSNINLSMRTTDDSHYEENGLTGLSRGFYPLYSRSVTGESKIPESSIVNAGVSSTVGNKYNFLMADVPWIRDEFFTRIMYSDIFINDSYRNGYRVFQLNHFRDYSTSYGGITKLVEFRGFLIAVFEHAVAVIPVNERALAGEGAGGEVFINTSNVLPENPKMLDTNYGSQWIESVEVTPNYVYGVDTVARKIWRTNGETFEVISDFKVQQFLNRNITLGERDLTPLIGVRNVKTHYNAYKQDVMFTYYDNLYDFEEVAWNLCFNELLGKFVTFYSWIPSFSANIYNIWFTFDRDSSKVFSKIAQSTTDDPCANGVTVSNPMAGGGTLSLANRYLPDVENQISTNVTFSLEKDPRGFWRFFTVNGTSLSYKGGLPAGTNVAYLNIKANVDFDYNTTDQNLAQYVNGWQSQLTANAGYYQNQICVIVGDYTAVTTDFWKHGQAGIIDIADKIKPCFWYGKQHPFEFEVVVADNPMVHKVFDNLYIVANKAKPESFHYEVVGEVYDFAKDKKNIYYRQEATKELYQNVGSDILYNRDYTETPIAQNVKSTIFPLYYERIDTFDQLYDSYQMATSNYERDYQNLTGTEIVHEPLLDEYRLYTHQRGNDIVEVGRLRGNMQYKEDIWNVEIRPIFFNQRNEDPWSVPPIILNNVPQITATEIREEDLPAGYDITDIENTPDDELIYTGWTDRKSTRIRDKYLKVRIRYAGNELAIISALKTIYRISFS